MVKFLLKLIGILYDFILQNPFSFFCAVVAIKTLNPIYGILWLLWRLNLEFLKYYGLYKTSAINLRDLISIYLANNSKYEFKEVTKNLFKNNKNILNSNKHLEEAIGFLGNKIQAAYSKINSKVDTSIRIFIANEKPPFTAPIKSFAIRGDTSYIFLDKEYDDKNLIEKYRLLHEIGHCQVLTGQGEFESITHKEYALSTVFMLLLSINFDSIIVVIIFILLSLNMIAKYDMRHKLSVIGYAEFLADAYALRYFYNNENENYLKMKTYIIEKYERDVERTKNDPDNKLIRFKYELLKKVFGRETVFSRAYLVNSGNIFGTYKKPLNPILLFNVFTSVLIFFNLFRDSWLLIIPVLILAVANLFKHLGQIAISTELSTEVRASFEKI